MNICFKFPDINIIYIIFTFNFSADNATFREAALQAKSYNNMDSSLADEDQQDSEARKKTTAARKRKTVAKGGRRKKSEESSAMLDNDAIEAEAARLAFTFPVSVPPPDVESEPTVAGKISFTP